MYEAFFGLRKKPFAMTPDPEFLFMTSSHQEALAGITYTILERKGFAVLTGDAGTGKTTLLHSVIGTLSGSSAYIAWILNPLLSTSELFELALLDLGLTVVPASKAQRIVEFQRFLLQANEENKTTVLIIDEAHKLDPQLLEEIRLLTNFESSAGKLLQIILAGQSELDELLERHDLRQLKQRIAVRLTVDPLYNTTQVTKYIAHRWSKAGGGLELPFSPDGVHLIDKLSRGLPRVINAICDSALLRAFADGTTRVSVEQIASVAVDLRLSPAREQGTEPSEPAPAAAPPGDAAVEPDLGELIIPPPPPLADMGTSAFPTLERYSALDDRPRAARFAERFGLKYRYTYKVRPS
jgi:general secretion pathway protein A